MYFTLKYFRMKFWKQTLLISILFSVVLAAVLYSACEKDNCNNVTCKNGGACNNGVCKCPTGYENTQCQTKSVARFVGVFAGYSLCNNTQQVIDTAFVYADTTSVSTINYVWVVLNSISPTVLHGYVETDQSTYSIIVPKDSAANYLKVYTITLQSNNRLNIASYEQYEITTPLNDTVINKCTFLGVDTATTN